VNDFSNLKISMLTHKAYRFRIYPTAEQEVLFRRTIGCCRLVYNLCLDQKKLERERSDPRRLTAFDPDQGTDGAEVRRGVFAGDTTPPFGAIGHGPAQGVQEFL